MGRFENVALLLIFAAAAIVISAISFGIMSAWDWILPDRPRLAALAYFATLLVVMGGVALTLDLRRKP